MSRKHLPVYDAKKAISYPQIAGIFGVILLIAYCSTNSGNRVANTSNLTASGQKSSNTGAPVGMTLTPQEQANYKVDPRGMGYGAEDRQFLKDHGVSEAEARAAEEVARRNGVD